MAAELESERLLVRTLRQDDLSDYHGLVYSDEEVCRFYSGEPMSLDEAREHLSYRILEAQYSDFQRWAIERKKDGQFIGIVGLEAGPNFWYRFKNDPEPTYNTVEVEMSFALGRAYWGKGFATEACACTIEYAFSELKIPRLLGGFALGNTRSQRLHERLNFAIELDADEEGYVVLLENALEE